MSTGISQWVCVRSLYPDYFTEGEIYHTLRNGNLVDNDGDERIRPDMYNDGSGIYKFEPVLLSFENK